MENAKIQKFKYDILSNFQAMISDFYSTKTADLIEGQGNSRVFVPIYEVQLQTNLRGFEAL